MARETKKNSKFPWSQSSTELLITLYGENIKNFLNPCKTQSNLWKKLVELMKLETKIPESTRDALTVPIATRKWIALQKEFKSVFYGQRDELLFPFYGMMSQLFTDYATEKLNSIPNIKCNQTTDADITSFVSQLLDQTGSMDISGLRCEQSSENVKPQFFKASVNESCSEASKVRKALAELPRSAISIQRANMKIVPNTPFNRHYQLSTILNYRNNSETTSIKRRVDSQTEPFIKKRISSINEKQNEITLIKTGEDSFEYEIEALNECNFSEIPNLGAFKTKPSKIHSSTAKTFHVKKSNGARNSDSPIIEEVEYSVLEVPSLEESSESRIIPKRLIMDEAPPTSSGTEQAPVWFKNFLNRYDSDMKTIEHRMKAIDEKLEKVLAAKSTSFSSHRNIAQIKQERR